MKYINVLNATEWCLYFKLCYEYDLNEHVLVYWYNLSLVILGIRDDVGHICLWIMIDGPTYSCYWYHMVGIWLRWWLTQFSGFIIMPYHQIMHSPYMVDPTLGPSEKPMVYEYTFLVDLGILDPMRHLSFSFGHF